MGAGGAGAEESGQEQPFPSNEWYNTVRKPTRTTKKEGVISFYCFVR